MSQAPKARILVVDDHPLVREGLTRLLSQTPDLTVCGEASSIYEALAALQRLDPDLALVDLSLRDGSGLSLIERIASQHERTKTLALSMHDEKVFAVRALQAGARGFVSKDEPSERTLAAIRCVLAGGLYLSAAVAGALTSALSGKGRESGGDALSALSSRELEVFEMTGRGLSTKEIAAALFLSVKTVETHRNNIKQKLGLKSATELIRMAALSAQSPKAP